MTVDNHERPLRWMQFVGSPTQLAKWNQHAVGKRRRFMFPGLANVNEIDLDIQYRPDLGALKGLWLRFRYGHVVQYQGTRSVIDQFRIIINYDFSLL